MSKVRCQETPVWRGNQSSQRMMTSEAAHLIRECFLSSIIGALALLAAICLADGAGEERVFGSMFYDASSFVFQHDGFDVET